MKQLCTAVQTCSEEETLLVMAKTVVPVLEIAS